MKKLILLNQIKFLICQRHYTVFKESEPNIKYSMDGISHKLYKWETLKEFFADAYCHDENGNIIRPNPLRKEIEWNDIPISENDRWFVL